MIDYLFYVAATGEITQTGSVSEDHYDIQARDGLVLMRGVADITKHYILNGVITAFTDAELAAKASIRPGFIWKMPERIVVDIRSLADAKTRKLGELSKACDAAIAPIKIGYPQGEQQTWDKQESEARAYTANSSASTPLMSALCAQRNITISDLAARIINKSDAFASACGYYIGKRQKHEDDVTSATTVAQVDAIVW